MKTFLKSALLLALVLIAASAASAQSCEIGSGSSCYPTIPSTSNLNGRWEFVHTTGDAGEQAQYYQGGYSTVLAQSGSKLTGSLPYTTTNTIAEIYCCDDKVTGSVSGFPFFQIITVDFHVPSNAEGNIYGEQPTAFDEVYTGTLNIGNCTTTSNASCFPTTITGTYTSTAGSNYTDCYVGNHSSSGCKFTATWFPAFKNSTYNGAFDAPDDGNGPSNVPVSWTITTNSDNTTLSGTITAGLFGTGSSAKACFAGPVTLKDVTNPLLIGDIGLAPNTEAPYAAGVGGSFLGEDKNGVQLWVNWYAANPNSDPAAVGELQYYGVPITQSNDDGTSLVIIAYYGITGGVCDGYGGGDAPFVLQGQKPAPKAPRREHRAHGHR